jgi:hypothetical protein
MPARKGFDAPGTTKVAPALAAFALAAVRLIKAAATSVLFI